MLHYTTSLHRMFGGVVQVTSVVLGIRWWWLRVTRKALPALYFSGTTLQLTTNEVFSFEIA
jgi:hypothetical protein